MKIEFTKTNKIFKNKVFADPRFDSGKIEFNDIIIDKLLHIQHNQLSSRDERETYGESGCTIYSILQHQLVILEVVPSGPCRGYPPVPNCIRLFLSVVNRIDIKSLFCNHILAKSLFFYKKHIFDFNSISCCTILFFNTFVLSICNLITF